MGFPHPQTVTNQAKEAPLQNITFRVPAKRSHYTVSSTGVVTNLDENSSSLFVFRTQTGYTGPIPKVKPMPVHAYSFNFQRISATQIQGDYYYSNGSHEHASGPFLNVVPGGATYSSYDISSLYNRALENLIEKMRGGLDLSIDLAEAGKTVKMLKIKDQVVSYTKTFLGRLGPVKAASNAWLAYTYGVRPLIQSLYGVADENIRVVINKTANFSGRASMKVVPKTVTLSTMFGPVTYPIVGGYVKHSVTLGVDVRTDQFDLARWSSLNPASIAWELMPFSFVVDWFYNVGGYLRSMETALLYGSKFRSGYRTNLSVGATTGLIIDKLVSQAETHTSIHKCTVDHVDIQRSVLNQFPAPSIPSLKAELGSSRLISASALLAQLLKGR